MFKNLSFKWQLGIGFAAVVCIFVVTLVTVGLFIKGLSQAVSEVNDRSLPLILAVDEMDLNRSEVQQFLTDVAATHDPAGYKDAQAAAERFQEGVEKFKRQLTIVPDTTKLKELASIESDFNTFYSLGKTMAETYTRDGVDAGNALMKGDSKTPGFDQASKVLSLQLTSFRTNQVHTSQQATLTAVSSATAIQQIMLVGGSLASLLAAAFGALIVRGMLLQLGGEPKLAARWAQCVGEGDLMYEIDIKSGDESSLMAHLQVMQSKLVQVVTNVRQGATSVSTASGEIAQGTLDLSSRTEQQASALEETAASMEQLSATVKQNADNADQARQHAISTSTLALQGGEVVAQVVGAMKGINDASSRIADITGIIDGIAFQTNILALNAAVEAARAGEQGRGFAVVATEVRSLARRSAEAAKEIKSLVNANVERVGLGTAQAEKAGLTMTEVISSIRIVSDLMGEISAASSEQSEGVSQVGEAVIQMDQVTQQNAALVEEMAAAASSLSSQAQELVQTVAAFNLGQETTLSHPMNYVESPRAVIQAPVRIEKRSPNRATNVFRVSRNVVRPLALKTRLAVAKTGNDGEWSSLYETRQFANS
jgi:methyl-accepting chemotaxis protein